MSGVEELAETIWDALDSQHDQARHIHAAECCWSFQGALGAITAALTASTTPSGPERQSPIPDAAKSGGQIEPRMAATAPLPETTAPPPEPSGPEGEGGVDVAALRHEAQLRTERGYVHHATVRSLMRRLADHMETRAEFGSGCAGGHACGLGHHGADCPAAAQQRAADGRGEGALRERIAAEIEAEATAEIERVGGKERVAASGMLNNWIGGISYALRSARSES